MTKPPPEANSVTVAPPERPASVVFAKRCTQLLFGLVVLPRMVTYGIARRLLGRRAFSAASESIARIPGMRGVYARQAFYANSLSRCGRDVYFGWMSVFSMTEARVGDRVYIGRFCSIGFADIGDDVMLADGVQILSGGREHATRESNGKSMQSQHQTYRRVQIGRGAWIGAGAIVMSDVGEGAVVGAGAVVTRPIPLYSVAAGVPARIVKSYDRIEPQFAIK